MVLDSSMIVGAMGATIRFLMVCNYYISTLRSSGYVLIIFRFRLLQIL